MNGLYLDLTKHICACSETAWVNLAVAAPDSAFGTWARSEPGRYEFIKLFTWVKRDDYYIVWRLLGYVHRIDGPAVIVIASGTLAWLYTTYGITNTTPTINSLVDVYESIPIEYIVTRAWYDKGVCIKSEFVRT